MINRLGKYVLTSHGSLVICLVSILASSCSEEINDNNSNWDTYLGDNFSSQYSGLTEINTTNVQQLKVAWEYSSRDLDSIGKSQIQCNSIIVDGVLYGTSAGLRLFALNAATGRQLWLFDPNTEIMLGRNVNRGVAFWQGEENKRIFYTVGPNLYGINAVTGKPIQTFGENGIVSLKEDIEDWAEKLFVVATSPGIIYEDKLIIGSRVSEGVNAAPGTIRAFNVNSGKLEWTFNTIPRPGEKGYDTWPEDAYTRVGGVNCWAGMSLDEERGIVYIPTGSASFDFYGGNRKGQNLFANCIIALNADSGEYIWHFQTVHHDLWDRDVPAPPNLVSIDQNGKKVDAVAVATKSGYVFVLDRETGEPVFPIEERQVRKSTLVGEESWPTQPFPITIPPFSRQLFSKDEITNISEEAHNYVASKLQSLITGESYIPPSLEGSILLPGFDGGGGWGGNSFDPTTGIIYINAKEIPGIIRMEERKEETGAKVDLGKYLYQNNCSMCHGTDMKGNPTIDYPGLIGISSKYTREESLQIIKNGKGGRMPGFGHIKESELIAIINYLYGEEGKMVDPHEIGMEDGQEKLPYTFAGYERFFDKEGYPAIKPPWGTLTAIDLNIGEIKWQVPLGEYKELTAKGIPKTGMVNYGGSVVTAGGLVFIAATKDEFIRAFNKDTGEEVWKYKLPAAGYATPSVYSVNNKQYLVIACGGGKVGSKSGDKYVAFSIPTLGDEKNGDYQ